MEKSKFTSILSIPDFDHISIREAESLFYAYKEKNVFRGGFFDEDVWAVCDEYANYRFNFCISVAEFEQFSKFLHIDLLQFKKCLKTYIMCQMGQLAIDSLQSIINGVKKVIAYSVTNLFDLANEQGVIFVNKVAEFFSMLPAEGRENELSYILDSLDAVDDQIRAKNKPGQRQLAAFESYFRFGDIVDSFWAESEDLREKLFFFPIYLWWHISGIIPMRPREFVLTPRNCLRISGDRTFLSIRKNKIKGSEKTISYRIDEDYIMKNYEIPEHLVKEIEWYLEETKDYFGTDIQTLFIADTHYAKWDRCKPYTSRYYTYVNLSTCLRYFFEEVINGRYGYTIVFERGDMRLKDREINYLHLGDTRHLSLINIIAEGATPMIAMMLAGHDEPDMASNYYANISQMIECKTYRQYKKMLKGKQMYSISESKSALRIGEFTLLEDNSRCYSAHMRMGGFSDCYKVAGPSGEIGYCKACTYHRDEGKMFGDSKDLYKGMIEKECASLDEIVKRVRKTRGDPEEIMQALLNLRSAEYSYQQYLMETMEEEESGKSEENHNR